MKILIIEDDDNKINQLSDFFKDKFSSVEFISKKSYHSGLRELIQSLYDFIILDMSMPMFDKSVDEHGGIFERFAGEKILREIFRKEIKTKIILFTMFESFGEGIDYITLPKLKEKLQNEFSEYYLDCVYYNASETKWKDELFNILNNYINQKQSL